MHRGVFDFGSVGFDAVCAGLSRSRGRGGMLLLGHGCTCMRMYSAASVVVHCCVQVSHALLVQLEQQALAVP